MILAYVKSGIPFKDGVTNTAHVKPRKQNIAHNKLATKQLFVQQRTLRKSLVLPNVAAEKSENKKKEQAICVIVKKRVIFNTKKVNGYFHH